jgi:hypothetical protein
MSSVRPAPIYDPIADEDAKASRSWILFFNGLFEGDTGTAWTPTFVNLTQTGTPTIAGYYYRVTRRLVYFRIDITPATDTSAVAGSTYIDNFPLTFSNNGICFAVTGNLGDGPGMVASATNRIYVPAWTTVTVPLTVIGICEAG